MTRKPKDSAADTGSHHGIFIAIIVAIVTGVLFGGFLPDFAGSFSLLGEVFLNALMMIVVPLVLFSMITGITGLGDIRKLGSIGWRTVSYYLITTAISVSVGLGLVNILVPGSQVTPGEEHPLATYVLDPTDNKTIHFEHSLIKKNNYEEKYLLTLSDQQISGVIQSRTPETITVSHWFRPELEGSVLLKTVEGAPVPIVIEDSILTAALPQIKKEGQGFVITLAAVANLQDKKERDVLSTLKEVLVGDRQKGKEGMVPRNVFRAMVNMDILPIILFALLLGAALSVLGEKSGQTIAFFQTMNDAIMMIVHWIMYCAPFGIFGLIAARIGNAGGFSGFLPELIALGRYFLTVMAGLAIHGLVVLPLILFFLGRKNPLTYAAGVGAALLNAFSTASSSATLPLTMEGVEQENGISNRTASFVLPLGATINMDGTALYEAVAALFIAQVYGIHLGFAEQTIVFLTATLAAIGAAGIPEAGLVTMVIVLKAVGLPLEGIGLILSIDWFLDRFRTTINVWGDSVGAAVIDRFEEKE